MEDAVKQLFYGFMAIYTIVVGIFVIGVVWHYEHIITEIKQQRDRYQQQLETALAKVMSVDYEKLMQIDIQARAQAAQAAWTFDKIHGGEYTDDLGEMIQEPLRVLHGRAKE